MNNHLNNNHIQGTRSFTHIQDQITGSQTKGVRTRPLIVHQALKEYQNLMRNFQDFMKLVKDT